MSTTKVRSATNADLKLEVLVIPVSDVDARRSSTGASGGGSMPTSPPTTSASSSSRHLAPDARSSSARTSPRRYPAPPRACT
jgi:hypothetical protein